MTEKPLFLKAHTEPLTKKCEALVPYGLVKWAVWEALGREFIENLPQSAHIELLDGDNIVATLSDYDPQDGLMTVRVEWEEEL